MEIKVPGTDRKCRGSPGRSSEYAGDVRRGFSPVSPVEKGTYDWYSRCRGNTRRGFGVGVGSG